MRILALDGYAAAGHCLGPDHASFAAVWLHGCDRHCKGCVAEAWNRQPPRLQFAASFFAELLLRECPAMTGVVLSGGEPMRQAHAVRSLLAELDARTEAPLGVMLYTGYTLGELQAMADPDVDAVLARLDILVDGPYIAALDDNQPYRGSSNQRIHCLTPRYSMADFTKTRREANIETNLREVSLMGIPDAETKAIWRAIYEAEQGREMQQHADTE